MSPGMDLRTIFFEEAEELLVALDEGLRQMERGDSAAETINAVFRAVHSIKGGAGAFALHDLVAYAHSFESLLDDLRTGQRLPEPEFLATLLEAADHLSDLVTAERQGAPLDPGRVAFALDRLKASGQTGQTHIRVEMAFDPLPLAGFDPMPLDFDALPLPISDPPPTNEGQDLVITIRPHSDAFRAGHDPMLLLRDLATFGAVEVLLETGSLPDPAAFDPTRCYLGWQVMLSTERPIDEVRAIFDFIETYCDISIERLPGALPEDTSDGKAIVPPISEGRFQQDRMPPGPSEIETDLAPVQPLPASDPSSDVRPRENTRHDTSVQAARPGPTVRQGQSARQTVGDAAPENNPHSTAPQAQTRPGVAVSNRAESHDVATGELPPLALPNWEPGSTAERRAPAETADPSPPKSAPPRRDVPPAEPARDSSQTPQKPTIRVDVERVDRLVNVAGELVIHNAMLADALGRSASADPHEIARNLDQLRQLSRMIQESAMAIRAQPVKPLFDRMHRILREAAVATSKKARLEIIGEATEVDRTIIERLADPLTHMVRNAVDHGIEKPADRLAAGKPEQGTVRIEAQHRSGRIMIIVSDDGGGVNRNRVRQIAIERGLIAANAELQPSEIDSLLFLPGFSTAREVSALSGRGVGMDVVRSSILALGGRIAITSNPGEGTAMTISLPLTLAVMDGMVIRSGGQPLVLPLPSIVETITLAGAVLHPMGDGSRLVELRGECLPMVNIAQALGLPPVAVDPLDQVIIVVEQEDKSRVALIADAIEDQRQIVIKSLDENYGHIDGIAAATVLGDGAVALIIDPAELVHGVSSRGPFAGFSAAAE